MKFIKKLLITFMLVLALCSCATPKQYIAYTIYPVGYLLNRIGKDRIQTISIQNNSIVQTATLKEDYKTILEDSAFLFHVRDLEPYLNIYESEINESGVTRVDLTNYNVNYDFVRYVPYKLSTGEIEYYSAPYYVGEIFDEIDMLDKDLYIWLDPIGMLSMATDVYDTLHANFAEQTEFFKENYEKLKEELIDLDEGFHSLAKSLQKNNMSIKFVSISNSFGNWQKAYGIQVYPVCLSRYGTLPTNDQLALIKERIINDGVKYIAYEPNMTQEMEDLFISLESELGLKRVNLYNISSLTASQSAENKDYLSLMNENLAMLKSMASED